MFNGIKALFSSSQIVEGVLNGADKIIHTSEEKADNFNVLLSLYAPFKIAQRLLALTFCPAYVLAWLITFTLSFFIDVTSQFEMLEGDISTIVGVIIAFYFGGGAVEGIIGKFKHGK